jgi:hypothetical protein
MIEARILKNDGGFSMIGLLRLLGMTVDTYQKTALTAKAPIRNAFAASALMSELELYGGKSEKSNWDKSVRRSNGPIDLRRRLP